LSKEKTMKRWLNRAIVAILASVMLTGCIASQTETKINADGSGTNTVKFGIEAQYIGMLSGLGGSETDDPFKAAKDEAAGFPAEWEAKTSDWKEKIDNRDFQGVQIDMKFKDLAMLNAQLEQIASQSSSDNPAGGSLTGLKVEEINNEFVVTGTANATDLAASGDTAGLGGGMEELRKAVIVWRVTMPGAVKEALPAEITTKDGNTVTWKIPADKTASYDLRIVAGKTGGSSGGGSLPLILGLVGGLILLGGLAFFFMNRRKAAPAVAAPYGQPGGYDPNASYGQPGGYQQPGQPGGYQQPGQPGGYPQPGTYDPNPNYGQQPGQPGGYQQPGQPGGYQQPGQPGQPGTYDPNDPNRR
jgi:hypothetical protein